MAAVRRFVSNAKAVLDSLNHYEFLKIRTSQLKTDLQFYQAANIGLKVQVVQAGQTAEREASGRREAEAKLSAMTGRFKQARTENWVWRSVGVILVVRTVSNFITALKK